VNALDEISQSYSYRGNLELDQTKHVTEIWDHEFVDLEMFKLLSRVCAFYEEEDMQSWIVLLCIFTL
jgi:hypothetical protein